ncbi:MAG: type Z 30S ribosomal protein S14 [Candidatus Omnitrophota bacterium]
MAKKSLMIKAKREPKFSTRVITRCQICGRKRGYMRRFDLCRICFRELASRGDIPGMRKASW